MPLRVGQETQEVLRRVLIALALLLECLPVGADRAEDA